MQPDRIESERDPRVFLAAERTLLAWVRTGLAMMGFGFFVARLELLDGGPGGNGSHAHLSLWGGVTLVIFGAVVNIIAAVQHARFIDRFNKGLPLRARPVSASVIVSLLVTVMGLAMVAYLYRTGMKR